MNICLFGGTFDPIHLGHLEIARAAADRFQLKQVLFCPAYQSPFKQGEQSAAYPHRFAMVALAIAAEEEGEGDKRFLASDLESPVRSAGETPNYTVDTVRRLKQQLGKSDRLFFLCGMDAFKDIAKWHEAEALLACCEFVVAARPGFPLADVAAALPASLRPAKAVLAASKQLQSDALVLRGANIHLLTETAEDASSTSVRLAIGNKHPTARQLPPLVAAYIKRQRLYQQRAHKK
ncbi:MAG: nicotinate (nicotinamide) nucleotide adenylyltransferase [Acidobacteriaceae bacterium]